jgi:hypothetical protein
VTERTRNFAFRGKSGNRPLRCHTLSRSHANHLHHALTRHGAPTHSHAQRRGRIGSHQGAAQSLVISLAEAQKAKEKVTQIDKVRSAPAHHRCAHNGLVGGSNPPGPTTQSCAAGDFLKVLRKAPNWRGSVRRFVPIRSAAGRSCRAAETSSGDRPRRPVCVLKTRFCNSGDEGRRGRAQIRCGPCAGWRDESERPC